MFFCWILGLAAHSGSRYPFSDSPDAPSASQTPSPSENLTPASQSPSSASQSPSFASQSPFSGSEREKIP